MRIENPWVQPLWQRFERWRKRSKPQRLSARIDQPILSEKEIIALADELAMLPMHQPVNPKNSEALRQGEQPSRFLGAGMEYEESRPYQEGDEIRRINWRLMARTGQAYTKRYQEERQESWYLLIDHRAAMRFGTRKRLKATQAARIAGYFAWYAQQAGIPVALGRLAENLVPSPTFEGRSLYSHIMQAASQPCPPYSPQQMARPEVSLNDVLSSLSHQLQPGSRLIIVSDFHDLSRRTVELLTAMQDFLAVTAVHISDASDHVLPDVEGVQLQSLDGQRCMTLNRAEQQQSYMVWAKQYVREIEQQLNQAGARYHGVTAHADLLEINRVLSSPSCFEFAR